MELIWLDVDVITDVDYSLCSSCRRCLEPFSIEELLLVCQQR